MDTFKKRLANLLTVKSLVTLISVSYTHLDVYKRQGSACYWWLRSVFAGGTTAFCYVYAGGGAGGSSAYCSNGFAPGFKAA